MPQVTSPLAWERDTLIKNSFTSVFYFKFWVCTYQNHSDHIWQWDKYPIETRRDPKSASALFVSFKLFFGVVWSPDSENLILRVWKWPYILLRPYWPKTTLISNVKLKKLLRGHFGPLCTATGYMAIFIHRQCYFCNQDVELLLKIAWN